MTFSEPRALWLLLAVPLVLLLEWHAARRSARQLVALIGARADHPLLRQRRPGERRFGAAMRAVALAALAFGAAGPEWGTELKRRTATGSDVVFVIDVSASMDARDVNPSRLEEARREALALLDRLGGSRVGVVAFAGDAVRLCPLTLDRGAVRLVIESLSSGTVGEPGTDLGRGLEVAARMLPGGRRSEQVVVLWTDGEDLEKGFERGIDAVVRAGQRVYAVGVGTRGGDVIPVLDEDGRSVDVKRDEAGAAVRSRLDETALREVARRTRGAYFSASRAGGETGRLLAAVGRLGRSERGERLVERSVPRYPWFAALAALALVLERARARRRIRGEGDSAGKRTGDSKAPAAGAMQDSTGSAPRPATPVAAALFALAVACGVIGPAATALAQSDWARGDGALRRGQWAAAESLYARRAARNAPPAVRMNRAVAGARAGKALESEAELEQLIETPGKTGQFAAYNLGTLRGERGETAAGLKALRRALELDPNDADARHNFEMLLRRKRPPGGPPQPQPPQPSPQSSPSPSEPQGPPQRGGQQPPPSGAQPPPGSASPSPSDATPQDPGPAAQGLNRAQADRILESLQELERRDQQRARRVKVVRERKGHDW